MSLTLRFYLTPALFFIYSFVFAAAQEKKIITTREKYKGKTYTLEEVKTMRNKIKRSIVYGLAFREARVLENLLKKAENAQKDKKTAECAKLTAEAAELIRKINLEHPFRREKNGDVILGGIRYSRKKNEITFPAEVSYHPEMPVEVLICRSDSERVYETLFTAGIRPLHLQTILYIAGCMNGARTKNKKQVRMGDVLHLSVRYKTKNGEVKERNIEDILTADKKPEKNRKMLADWIFVGSSVYKGKLVSDLTGESVLVWSVSSSILAPSSDKVAGGAIHVEFKKYDDLPNHKKITFVLKPILPDTGEGQN